MGSCLGTAGAMNGYNLTSAAACPDTHANTSFLMLPGSLPASSPTRLAPRQHACTPLASLALSLEAGQPIIHLDEAQLGRRIDVRLWLHLVRVIQAGY